MLRKNREVALLLSTNLQLPCWWVLIWIINYKTKYLSTAQLTNYQLSHHPTEKTKLQVTYLLAFIDNFGQWNAVRVSLRIVSLVKTCETFLLVGLPLLATTLFRVLLATVHSLVIATTAKQQYYNLPNLNTHDLNWPRLSRMPCCTTTPRSKIGK